MSDSLAPSVAFGLVLLWELAWPGRVAPRRVGARWFENLGLMIGNWTLIAGLSLLAGVAFGASALDPMAAGAAPGPAPRNWLGAAGGLMLLDAATYALHRGYHWLPMMWRFHQVHHSDQELDATTAVRHHAGEALLSFGALNLLAWATGVAGSTVAAYVVLAAIVQFFQHANITLPPWAENRIGLVVLTPGLHAVHHEAELSSANSNFGTVLSVWDRVFDSLCRPARPPASFGVAGEPAGPPAGLAQLFAAPFRRNSDAPR